MFNDLLNPKKKVYQKYFDKTGIQLTDEPIPSKFPEIDDQLQELYDVVFNNPRKALPRIKKLLEKYPSVPSLKNYLFIAYKRLNKEKDAEKILKQTLEDHPDYIFGISNAIMRIQEDEELRKNRHLLGSPPNILTITGPRVIHITEFANYQVAVGHYAAFTGDETEAMKRLESLIEIEAEKRFTEPLAYKISVNRIQNASKRFEKENEMNRTVDSFPKIKLSPSKTQPSFHHSEIEVFYQKSIEELSESELEKIISLPRLTLIEDLEKVIEDSIRRWEYFQELDYDESTHEFVFHALYCLGALEVESSLPKVLNLLRMGEEFIDYWFADYIEEVFYVVISGLAKNQLKELYEFAKEENIHAFGRLTITKVVSQISLHQPDRREEIINWFSELIKFHLKQLDNENLIDSVFLGFTAGNLVDIRAVELLPLIEELYANNLIPDMYQGNLVDMTEKIKKEQDPYYLEPLPLNIYEYYSRVYKKRRASLPDEFKLDEDIIGSMSKLTEAEKMVNGAWSKALFGKSIFEDEEFEEEENDYYDNYEEVRKPIVRTSPKVGRNDPCPCGSGKKYKKCCWRK